MEAALVPDEKKSDKNKVTLREGQKTILIISDNQGHDRDIIRHSLKEMGYGIVKSLKSALEGVDLLEGGVGNLFVVNAENEFLSGLDALKRIRGNPDTAHIPVIITSFSKEADLIMAGREAGMDGYVIKPLTPKAISEDVTNASRARQSKIRQYRKGKEEEISARSQDLVAEHTQKKELHADVIDKLDLLRLSFPWDDEIFTELGKILIRYGMGTKGTEMLREAERLNPYASKPLLILADYFSEKGNYAMAIKNIRQILSLSKSFKTYQKLGELQLKSGELADAIVTFNRVVTLIESDRKLEDEKMADKKKQELSKGLNLRGKAYREKGEKDDNANLMNHAAADFEEAGKLDPGFLSAHYNLMVTYKKMGQPKKALGVLDRIKTMEPKDADSWIGMAEAYYRDNEMSKVGFALEQALKLEKGNMKYYKEVSQHYIEFEMFEKAEALLLKVLEADPDDVVLHNNLGIVYRRLGKPEAAIERYEIALKVEANDVGLHFNLGRALLDTGKPEAAAEHFKKCLELDHELDEAKKFLQKIEKGETGPEKGK